MQAYTQPFLHFQRRSTVQKTPADIPVRQQRRLGRPSGLSFEDMCIHYDSGQKEQRGHIVQKKQSLAPAQLQAMPGQGVVQLWDITLKPINYFGVDNTTLGRAASTMARANRSRQNRFPFRSWSRYGHGRYGHSDILRASLVQDAWVVDPANSGITNQAHHIVETSNYYGQRLLIRYGIEPDSAVNGVLLPTYATDDTGNTSIHYGNHSPAYTAGINAALNKAVADAQAAAPQAQGRQKWIQERDAVIRKLKNIRFVLLTQNVPLNGSSDPNYNPVTASGETIADIFRRTGLI